MSIKGAVQGLVASGIGAANVVHQANVDEEKKAEAVKVQQKTEADKQVDELYQNTTSDLLGDVYKTTRKADRNVYMQQFTMANNLAKQRQEFLNFQLQAVKDRMKKVGLTSIEGQALKKKTDAKVQDFSKGVRKELTQFRKPVGGNK